MSVNRLLFYYLRPRYTSHRAESDGASNGLLDLTRKQIKETTHPSTDASFCFLVIGETEHNLGLRPYKYIHPSNSPPPSPILAAPFVPIGDIALCFVSWKEDGHGQGELRPRLPREILRGRLLRRFRRVSRLLRPPRRRF